MKKKIKKAVSGLRELSETQMDYTGVSYPHTYAVKKILIDFDDGIVNKKEILFYFKDFKSYIHG